MFNHIINKDDHPWTGQTEQNSVGAIPTHNASVARTQGFSIVRPTPDDKGQNFCVTYCVGVLALQGAFERHRNVLGDLGCRTISVRSATDLKKINGLVIPGGESTVIGKLLVNFGLLQPLRQMIEGGLPVFATCAGTILLAKEIVGKEQPSLNVLDIAVRRNAYGRQIESFEADIEIPSMLGRNNNKTLELSNDNLFRAVFIRAPIIERIGPDVKILAEYHRHPVLTQAGVILAATFHPELTGDTRIHQYFLDIIEKSTF